MKLIKQSIEDMAHNFEVLIEEREAYREEVKRIIKPGIKNADEVARAKGKNKYLYRLHKLSAYGEEWFDKRPRTMWYYVCLKTVFVRPTAYYLIYLGLTSLAV